MFRLPSPVSAKNFPSFTAGTTSHNRPRAPLPAFPIPNKTASWGPTPLGAHPQQSRWVLSLMFRTDLWSEEVSKDKFVVATLLCVSHSGFFAAEQILKNSHTQLVQHTSWETGRWPPLWFPGFRTPSSGLQQCCFIRHIRGTSSSFVQPPSGWRRRTERRSASPEAACGWLTDVAIVYWSCFAWLKGKSNSERNFRVKNSTFLMLPSKISNSWSLMLRIKQSVCSESETGGKACTVLTTYFKAAWYSNYCFTHLTSLRMCHICGLSSIIFCIHGQPEDENQTVWPEHTSGQWPAKHINSQSALYVSGQPCHPDLRQSFIKERQREMEGLENLLYLNFIYTDYSNWLQYYPVVLWWQV